MSMNEAPVPVGARADRMVDPLLDLVERERRALVVGAGRARRGGRALFCDDGGATTERHARGANAENQQEDERSKACHGADSSPT
jgi:hypothetical protein